MPLADDAVVELELRPDCLGASESRATIGCCWPLLVFPVSGLEDDGTAPANCLLSSERSLSPVTMIWVATSHNRMSVWRSGGMLEWTVVFNHTII